MRYRYRTHDYLIPQPRGPLTRRRHAQRKGDRRRASLARRDERRLERLRAALDLAGAAVRPTGIGFLGSSNPLNGYGPLQGVSPALDAGLEWRFRYRFDAAYLEIREAFDADHAEGIPPAVLVASRHAVLGRPYAGWLPEDRLERLLVELFASLHPPAPGERFVEQLAASVARLTASADDGPSAAS